MSATTYNGWKNYATWRINLEICDDYLDSLQGQAYKYQSTAELADILKDYVDEVVTNYGALEGVAVDYARAFIDDVDWYEIAEHAPELIASDDDETEEEG